MLLDQCPLSKLELEMDLLENLLVVTGERSRVRIWPLTIFYSAAEHQERYKEECQSQFDLQNKQLITDRVLTTDDSSSEDDYDDIDKMEKNLDALFT